MPRLLNFVDGPGGIASKWTYTVVGTRRPSKGEFYVSGAIPEAYRARNDLTTEYMIVQPVREYVQRQTWVPK